MRKTISFLLIAAFMLCMSTVAIATDDLTDIKMSDPTLRYTGISHLTLVLDINSSGKATCIGTVKPNDSTYTSYLLLQLGKYVNGQWQEVNSWTASGVGFSGANICKERYVTSGDYALRLEAKVYDANNTLLDNVVRFSSLQSY